MPTNSSLPTPDALTAEAEQDSLLFRQAVQGATPLPPSARRSHTQKPARVVLHPADEPPSPPAIVLSDHGADEYAQTEFLRNGLNRMTLRKLRRGEWRIQDEIDMHGMNADQARSMLLAFLQAATQRGLRCVNVVHGKGWRSAGRDGILKTHVRYWLMQHPQVLAYCEPPQHAGGGGAVWVLLKSTPT